MSASKPLWSLWDMLTLFVPGVTSSLYNLGLLSERLVFQGKQAVGAGHKEARFPIEMMKSIYASVIVVQMTAEAFGLIVSKAQSDRCIKELQDSFKPLDAENVAINLVDVERIGYALSTLSSTFSDELTKNVFVAARRGDDDLLKDGVRPFGPPVADAFPSAIYDVEEAARCRALYRWTASVTHLMRALEPALSCFQASLHVNVPKKNWQDILNQIDAKIKANGHKHPDHAWNSEASLQFLRFKDAWRNYAMHGKERYDEERAIAIYDSVRHFMQHLATRLSEAP